MSPAEKERIRPLLIFAAAFLLAHLAQAGLPGVLTVWNARVFDQFFRLRSVLISTARTYHPSLSLVDLNNSTLRDLSESYLNRTHFARVVANLEAIGVGAQVYDLIFAGPVGKEDNPLMERVQAAPNVLFGVAFDLNATGSEISASYRAALESSAIPDALDDVRVLEAGDVLMTFPELASRAHGVGFLNPRPDADGVFRRMPLVVRFRGRIYPSLALVATAAYLGVPLEKIAVASRELRLIGGLRTGQTERDLVIPVDEHGRMIVNFAGGWDAFTHYSFSEVLLAADDRDELSLWQDELGGHLVLVSDVSTGAADVGPVPTDPNFPLSGLHAAAIHTILSEDFLRERGIGTTILVDVVLLVLSVAACRLRSFTFLLSGTALGLGCVIAAVCAFLFLNWMTNLVVPLIGLTTGLTVTLCHRYLTEERERAFLRRSFEAYFPPSVVERIMRQPEILQTGGQKKVLTVLFSDIKNFGSHRRWRLTTYSGSSMNTSRP